MGMVDMIFGDLIEESPSGGETTVAEESAKVDRETAAPVPTTEPMCRVAKFVMDTFRVAAEHRRNSGVDERLRYALMAQTCRYSEAQKAKLKAAGVDEGIYAPITATKVRAAKAMLVDIFNSTGEWPFTVDPTPDPEVPRQVEEEVEAELRAELAELAARLRGMGVERLGAQAQETVRRLVDSAARNRYDEIMNRKLAHARSRARRMERRVQDIMAEGGWHDMFSEYVDAICTFGTAVVVMTPRVTAVNRCREGRRGARRYRREYRVIPTFEAVSPFDCYPAPDARGVDDGPICFRVKYTADELWRSATSAPSRFTERADGWMWGTVRSLLARHPRGGIRIDEEPYDAARREAEKNGAENFRDCTIEGVRCFASVRGSDLIEFGVTRDREGGVIRADEFREVDVIVIGGYVVYCRIIDDRLGRPISKGVFYELPGSWWGESIADKLRLVQSVMNNAIKALMQNMSVASGPMYWINDTSRLADRTPEGLKFRPHKIFPFQASMMGNSGAPMGVVAVPSNASELLAVWDKMKVQADDDSGIPAYTYGQSSGQGALRTASGLAIFSEAASRGMKMVIGTTDRLVTRDQVRKICNYILLYDTDLDIKGDCEIHAAGVMGKILKAQQDQQRQQLFQMAASNPLLVNIIGERGIMALFRPMVQDVNINPDEVLPSEERMREIETLRTIERLAAAEAGMQAGGSVRALPGGGGGVMGAVPAAPAAPAAGVTRETEPRPGSVAERRSAA